MKTGCERASVRRRYIPHHQRDALGREVAKLLPNGVTTYHAYDLAGQVTSIIHAGPGGVLQSLEYTYDDDGQRTKIVREDGTRIYFSYDLAHRLTGEDWLDPSDVHLYAFAYDYDAAGNRLKKTFNGEVTYYDYNNLNQLTTEAVLGGDATYYTWTADGAMETKHDVTGWTYYTWDVDESLTQIAAPNVTLDNKYNARMQRVQREEDATAANLIYDAQKLIAEATEQGLTRYYLSEGGSVYSPLVSQLGSQHWQLFDALGTVLGLTATDGSQSDSFLYEAFGTSLGRTGTTETPYHYVGGYGYFNEPSVGLEQVWWRWLEPGAGRWVSLEPAAAQGGYCYAGLQPSRFIDADGELRSSLAAGASIGGRWRRLCQNLGASCLNLAMNVGKWEECKCAYVANKLCDDLADALLPEIPGDPGRYFARRSLVFLCERFVAGPASSLCQAGSYAHLVGMYTECTQLTLACYEWGPIYPIPIP